MAAIKGKAARDILKKGIEMPDGRILQLCKLVDLRIDSSYQRPIVTSTVARIVDDASYQADAIGIVNVGQREATRHLNITDGQCRVEGLRRRLENGQDAPEEIPCLIRQNTSRHIEAMDFVACNTAKAVSGASRFRAKIIDKESPESIINRQVISAGFVLEFSQPGRPTEATIQPNGIRTVHILLRCYNNCPDTLPSALRFLTIANGTRPTQVPFDLRVGSVIYAIALFLDDQDDVDVVFLAKTFRSRGYQMAAKWIDIYKGSSRLFLHDKCKLFAKWLRKCCRQDAASQVA